jgi:hypothetical protein
MMISVAVTEAVPVSVRRFITGRDGPSRAESVDGSTVVPSRERTCRKQVRCLALRALTDRRCCSRCRRRRQRAAGPGADVAVAVRAQPIEPAVGPAGGATG